jgi:hypothetical protein
LLERIYFESVWLRGPGFADEFVWGEAPEGFEPPGEVVGVDEVLQMGSQLVVGVIEVAFDSRVLDGAVHSFELPIGPWMLGLCQPVIDVVLGAGVFEGVRPNELSSLPGGLDVRCRRARIAWRGEVGSIVGEDGMDLVRDGGDQAAQEVLPPAQALCLPRYGGSAQTSPASKNRECAIAARMRLVVALTSRICWL